MSLLAVDDITVSYGRLTALRGVTLKIAEGEILFVTGPNGAGKSTLLNAIAGVVPSGSGTITLAGGMITVYPPEGKGYDNPMYEPLWAAAQDLDIPIGMHIATNRPGPGQDFALEDRNRVRNSFLANADHWVRMSLSDMIFSGVFERYPKLKVGTVEHELSWIPHFLDRIDYTYTQRVQQERYRFKEAMLPSDYFHRNVFAGFQEDAMGIRDRHIIGVDNLLWGSDYPHVESTFPRSRQIIEDVLGDCTEEEKAKIAGGNAARIYHLN